MSTLKVNTIQDVNGVEKFTATAWVNFNGTGTVAISDSGNVSSITDNGTGSYTLNFTTAMANANFAALVTTQGTESRDTGVSASNHTIGGFDIECRQDNSSSYPTYDSACVSVAVLGGR